MHNSWLIRKATIRDIERVRKMQAQSWRDTYENKELGVTKDWLRDETDLWLTPNEIKKSEEFMRPFLEDEKNNFYWKVPKGNTLESDFGKIVGRKDLKNTFTSRNLNTFEKVLKKF